MFHWCPSRDLKDSLMDRQEAAMTVLQVRRIVFHIQYTKAIVLATPIMVSYPTSSVLHLHSFREGNIQEIFDLGNIVL